MNRLKFIFSLIAFAFLLASCTNTNLVDTNDAMPENNWSYAKSIKASFEVKDVNEPYNLYFKLRHTADYRYANLYLIVRIKGNGLKKNNRYQYKLAKADGEWLGKGSGDIFTYNFPLLTSYRFAKPGKYEIEIEQNMRDNPLVGISDVGITVAKAQIK
jgi:gliding motility-associated lipoprotein GldH